MDNEILNLLIWVGLAVFTGVFLVWPFLRDTGKKN